MPAIEAKKWFHSNQYSADSTCEHCAGVVGHEPWCITRNEKVCYAFEVALDASKLNFEDELILHALGVTWQDKSCRGNCQGKTVTH